MSTCDSGHLSADDLDLLLTNTPTIEATSHVSICDECRRLVESERWLVAELERLPTFEPSIGFTDRVLAEVATGGAIAPNQAGSSLRIGRRAIVIASLLGMLSSTIWTMLNRQFFDQVIAQIIGLGTRWTDLTLQNAVAVITAQSWFSPISTVLASPLGWVTVGGIIITLWAAGMLALRRLVATGITTVSEPGW